MRKAFAAYAKRTEQARAQRAEQLSRVWTPWDLWREGAEYAVYPEPLKSPYHARRFEVGAATLGPCDMRRRHR